MAKRTLKPKHQEEIREKIRGSQLLNLVQAYALKGKYRGKDVEPKRVDAALGLLRKLVPDMSSQEITDRREGWIDVMKRLAETEKRDVQPQQTALEEPTQGLSKSNALADGAKLH